MTSSFLVQVPVSAMSHALTSSDASYCHWYDYVSDRKRQAYIVYDVVVIVNGMSLPKFICGVERIYE